MAEAAVRGNHVDMRESEIETTRRHVVESVRRQCNLALDGASEDVGRAVDAVQSSVGAIIFREHPERHVWFYRTLPTKLHNGSWS